MKIINNDKLFVIWYSQNGSYTRTVFILFNKELAIEKFFITNINCQGVPSGYGLGYADFAIQEGTYEQIQIGFSDSSLYSVCFY